MGAKTDHPRFPCIDTGAEAAPSGTFSYAFRLGWTSITPTDATTAAIYVAMAFSLVVEALNLRARGKRLARAGEAAVHS